MEVALYFCYAKVLYIQTYMYIPTNEFVYTRWDKEGISGPCVMPLFGDTYSFLFQTGCHWRTKPSTPTSICKSNIALYKDFLQNDSQCFKLSSRIIKCFYTWLLFFNGLWQSDNSPCICFLWLSSFSLRVSASHFKCQ